MKAKVIKTGEIINVIPMDGGCVANFVNGARHFEDSELDFEFADWGKFRREAAKMAMGQLIGMGRDDGYKYSPAEVARYAIVYADELIRQIKEDKK